MKNNKVWLIVLIGILFLAGIWVVRHSRPQLEGKVSGKPQVIVSMPLLKHLVSRIGGNEITVVSIVKGAGCNHEYEPTSQDLKLVAGSALFIKVGMGFDRWADQLIKTVAPKGMRFFDASQGISPLAATEADEDDATDQHHDSAVVEENHHHADNPHYWGSPDNVKIMARNILTALLEMVPEKKLQLTKNYNEYINELEQVCTGLKARVDALPDKRIVSYSAAFPYFYQYFGFQNLATVESTCEQEISPKHLAKIARLIKEKQVKVLVGETVYPNLPENLARETAAKLVLLWPGTNEAEDYPATIKENVEKLVTALR